MATARGCKKRGKAKPRTRGGKCGKKLKKKKTTRKRRKRR